MSEVQAQSIKDIDLTPKSGRYYRFQEGENVLRIASKFVPRKVQFRPEDEPKTKWSCKVIDRRDNSVVFATLGRSIMSQIKKLALNKEYAFEVTPEYDLTITKQGTGLDTKYDVIAARQNTALTDEEKKAIEESLSIEDFVKEENLRTVAKVFGGEVVKQDEISVDEIPF